MKISALLLCLTGAFGCTTHRTERVISGFIDADMRRQVSRIVVADGIDRNEAQLLATAYFFRFISGCGGPEAPKRRDTDWVVQVIVGYFGTPVGFIHVDARTGAVSYDGKSPGCYFIEDAQTAVRYRLKPPTVYPKNLAREF